MSEGARAMLAHQARALLTRRGVAEVLGKSRSLVMYYTLTGELKPTIIGGQRFYDSADVARLKRKLDARRGIEPSK